MCVRRRQHMRVRRPLKTIIINKLNFKFKMLSLGGHLKQTLFKYFDRVSVSLT